MYSSIETQSAADVTGSNVQTSHDDTGQQQPFPAARICRHAPSNLTSPGGHRLHNPAFGVFHIGA